MAGLEGGGVMECVRCGRLVDRAGLCVECRAVKPQRVVRRGGPGHWWYVVTSSVETGRNLGELVRERVWRLSVQGLSAREIALEVGCSQRAVYRVRAQYRDAVEAAGQERVA